MDFALFMAIVDAAPFAQRVHPYSRGEPLLYPHIIEAVKYITQSGKESEIYSNASLLTSDVAKGLFEAGLTDLILSVDENSGERFESIRKLSWQKVLTNIEGAVKIRDDMGVGTRLKVSSCVGDFNIDRIGEIRDFWLNIVDEVNLGPYVPLPPETRLDVGATVDMSPVSCNQPYYNLLIRVNGVVTFCCMDWYDTMILGRVDRGVTKDRLLDIYNNKDFNAMRYGMEFGKNAPVLCSYCQYARRCNQMVKDLQMRGVEATANSQ